MHSKNAHQHQENVEVYCLLVPSLAYMNSTNLQNLPMSHERVSRVLLSPAF